MSAPPPVPTAARFAYGAALALGAVVPILPPLLTGQPSDIVSACGLLLIAAGCLVLSAASGPRRSAFLAASAAAGPGLLVLSISLLPVLVLMLAMPLLWFYRIWSGAPTDVLLPPEVRYPVEVAFAHHQAIAMLIVAVAAGLVTYAVKRSLRPALLSVAIVAPVALPLSLAAAHVSWPAVPFALVGAGSFLATTGAIAPFGLWRRVVAGVQGFFYAIAGTAACLAERPTTVAALAVLTVATVLAAWLGRPDARVPATILAVLTASLTGITAVVGNGGTQHQTSLGILAAAVAAVIGAAAIRASRRRQASAAEATAHVVMLAALMLTAGSLSIARLVCGVWTLVLVARIAWPSTSPSDRRFFAGYAAVWAAVTWCLLLGQPEQRVTEPYTLSFAGALLIGGWAARRRWRSMRAWVAYGPAVVLAVAPTLVIATETGEAWRYALGGSAVAAVVVFAAARRLRTTRAGARPAT